MRHLTSLTWWWFYKMLIASVGIVANFTVIFAFLKHKQLRRKIPNMFIIDQVSSRCLVFCVNKEDLVLELSVHHVWYKFINMQEAVSHRSIEALKVLATYCSALIQGEVRMHVYNTHAPKEHYSTTLKSKTELATDHWPVCSPL